LSPLDPQLRYKGQMISALTFRRAYNRLCEMFEKKQRDEAPYPQQAMTDKLDPFIMEDWNASVMAAEVYAAQILQLSKYEEAKSVEIAHALIHDYPIHDSDINYDEAKELGLRVEKYDASERTARIWRHFRAWLAT